MKPMNPTLKMKTFLATWYLVTWGQSATTSMIGGAIRAKVEELAAPTKEMNRSKRGMAAARATISIKIQIKH